MEGREGYEWGEVTVNKSIYPFVKSTSHHLPIPFLFTRNLEAPPFFSLTRLSLSFPSTPIPPFLFSFLTQSHSPLTFILLLLSMILSILSCSCGHPVFCFPTIYKLPPPPFFPRPCLLCVTPCGVLREDSPPSPPPPTPPHPTRNDSSLDFISPRNHQSSFATPGWGVRREKRTPRKVDTDWVYFGQSRHYRNYCHSHYHDLLVRVSELATFPKPSRSHQKPVFFSVIPESIIYNRSIQPFRDSPAAHLRASLQCNLLQ